MLHYLLTKLVYDLIDIAFRSKQLISINFVFPWKGRTLLLNFILGKMSLIKAFAIYPEWVPNEILVFVITNTEYNKKDDR